MQNSKHSSSIQSVVDASLSRLPVVTVRSFAAAGRDLARVVLDVTHTSTSSSNPSGVWEAFSAKLQGKCVAVASSFRSVEKGMFTERLVGVVGRVREILALDGDQDLKGFKAFASNMFIDDEKDMWVLKKTESGSILIKTSAGDDQSVTSLLETVSSASYSSGNEYRSLAAMCSSTASKVEGGSFVTFVDHNNTLCCGFVVATTEDQALVLTTGGDEETIDVNAVVDIADTEELPETQWSPEEIVEQSVSSSSGKFDVNYLLEYYKKVYARDPKYYAELEARIKAHA